MSSAWYTCPGCYDRFYTGYGSETCSRECATTVRNWRNLHRALVSFGDAIDFTAVIQRLSSLEWWVAEQIARDIYSHTPYLFAHGTRPVKRLENK